jgi:hypothetical protein
MRCIMIERVGGALIMRSGPLSPRVLEEDTHDETTFRRQAVLCPTRPCFCWPALHQRSDERNRRRHDAVEQFSQGVSVQSDYSQSSSRRQTPLPVLAQAPLARLNGRQCVTQRADVALFEPIFPGPASNDIDLSIAAFPTIGHQLDGRGHWDPTEAITISLGDVRGRPGWAAAVGLEADSCCPAAWSFLAESLRRSRVTRSFSFSATFRQSGRVTSLCKAFHLGRRVLTEPNRH